MLYLQQNVISKFAKLVRVTINTKNPTREGRHSKSIDPTKVKCRCGGTFALVQHLLRDGTPRTPSAFAQYLSKNMKQIKRENPTLSHKELMQLISQKYRETTIRAGDAAEVTSL